MADEVKEYGPLAVLNQRDLARLFFVSTTTIQRMRTDERFPKKKVFGGGVSGWLYKDILTYIENAPTVENDNEE